MINVLSLFDGMSCGRLALERAGVPVSSYYASEIDKHAIAVAKDNWPLTEHIGDVTKVKGADAPVTIDLLLAGSPCQGFSFAGKQLNFNDPRSALYFEFLRILRETTPRYFLLENVKMKKEYQDVISEHLGVEPIEINSRLVSGQNRRRLYWTSIPNVQIPEDKGITLTSILEPIEKVARRFYVSEKQLPRIVTDGRGLLDGGVHLSFKSPLKNADKSVCLVARDYKGIPGREYHSGAFQKGILRKLTIKEYERLQTVPDNYTKACSVTQAYKMLGNGWTVDVIAHILRSAKF